MTTDITELALLISKAKASVFTLEYISQFEPADIDSDDVDLRFEVDGRDTSTNVSIVDECGQATKVIDELVEALELKEEQRANWFQMAQKLGEDLDAAEKRIAELESRTVTVKLPDNTTLADAPEQIWLQTDGVWPADGEFSELTWCTDRQRDDDTLYVRADLAAGIKLEAE